MDMGVQHTLAGPAAGALTSRAGCRTRAHGASLGCRRLSAQRRPWRCVVRADAEKSGASWLCSG